MLENVYYIEVVQFSHSVMSNYATPWTAARQASLSITNSRSLIKLMSIKSVMPSNHLILCSPLLLPPSIFQSISPSFRMDWFDLLAAQGTLKSLLQPQFKSINSSALSFLYGPALISIYDYWKNHSFDYMDLCRQSNFFAFQYTVYVCHSFSSKKQVSFNFLVAVTICSDFGAPPK